VPGSVVEVASSGYLTLKIPLTRCHTTTLERIKKQTLMSLARKRSRGEIRSVALGGAATAAASAPPPLTPSNPRVLSASTSDLLARPLQLHQFGLARLSSVREVGEMLSDESPMLDQVGEVGEEARQARM